MSKLTYFDEGWINPDLHPSESTERHFLQVISVVKQLKVMGKV